MRNRLPLLLLLVLACASLAWTLPPDRQVLTVDGNQATIIRDGYGVPHIFADNERALYYADGWAAAQDRLAQMEKYRRTARGSLAEIAGPSALTHDRQVREQGYTEEEYQRQVDAVGPRYLALLQAYTDGVNAWMAEAKATGQLPAEVKQMGIELERWRNTDTAAIGGMMARRFGSGGGEELRAQQMYTTLKEKLGPKADAVFADLAVAQDPFAPTTIPRGEGEGSVLFFQPKVTGRPLPAATREGLAQALTHTDWAQHEPMLASLGVTVRLGSYAWVVGPSRTASRAAILVGGPQMGFTTPQIAHEVHLCGTGMNTMGMGFAGVPGVMIGMNDRLAWTTTSADADLEDIFAEKINPQNRYQYWHNGKWVDMTSRTELIKVRGAEPVSMTIYRTLHGPVASWDEKAGIAYAHAYSSWMREMGTLQAVVGFNRATNIRQFGDAAQYVTTTHNWLCATQDGDIGFWFCGKVPVRAQGIDLRLPTPGTGEYDWRGDIPFARMPHLINPKQGFFANWNNKPAWWWAPGETSGWINLHRMTGIARAITRKPVLTFTDVRDITRDIGINVYQADLLKPVLLRAANRTGAWKDPALAPALRQLAAWDNHAINQSVAPVIFQAWSQAFCRQVLGDDLYGLMWHPDQAIALVRRVIDPQVATPKPHLDYLRGRSPDKLAIEALRQALDKLAQTRGPEMSLWTHDQGRINFPNLSWIPNYSRGTYIQVVELARPQIYGVNILPPGQSEDPASPHYSDQRELAGYWMFKPMVYLREDLEK